MSYFMSYDQPEDCIIYSDNSYAVLEGRGNEAERGANLLEQLFIDQGPGASFYGNTCDCCGKEVNTNLWSNSDQMFFAYLCSNCEGDYFGTVLLQE